MFWVNGATLTISNANGPSPYNNSYDVDYDISGEYESIWEFISSAVDVDDNLDVFAGLGESDFSVVSHTDGQVSASVFICEDRAGNTWLFDGDEYDFETAKYRIQEWTLTVDIEVMKYTTADASDLRKLGFR